MSCRQRWPWSNAAEVASGTLARGVLSLLADVWNRRFTNLVGASLPIDHSDRETSKEARKATVDIAPAWRHVHFVPCVEGSGLARRRVGRC